jgi:redox-sensitive bicupin YhaK (pirin superfamily)
VAIWTIKMRPKARFELPPAGSGVLRTLYFFGGETMRVDHEPTEVGHAIALASDRPVTLENTGGPLDLLLLQGRPIGEPVAHHGPFVMNTRQELEQAVLDYRRTGYGGWPFSSDGPVHPREAGRFARHADGRIERAD